MLLDSFRPDLAVVDLRLPDDSGICLIDEMRTRKRVLIAVLVSAYLDHPTSALAARNGAVTSLPKPICAVDVLHAAAHALGERVAPVAYKPATLEDIEHEHIRRAFLRCDGSTKRVAKELGISEKTLRRRLQGHPVELWLSRGRGKV